MAKATSKKDCIQRHLNYIHDTGKVNLTNPIQMIRVNWMAEQIPVGCKALDVGCNSGSIAKLVKAEWYGVDVSGRLINEANKVMRAQVAEAENLPFNDDEFDVVVLGEILEHVFNPEDVMDEAVRVSRGVVIGTTPHELGRWGTTRASWHPPETHTEHVRCFTRETLSELFKKYTDEFTIGELPEDGKRPDFYSFILVAKDN